MIHFIYEIQYTINYLMLKMPEFSFYDKQTLANATFNANMKIPKTTKK